MTYLRSALVALIAYTLVAPLMRVATRDGAIPSAVAAAVSNSVLVVAAVAVVWWVGEPVTPYLTHSRAPYVYAAGVCLAVGILAYYHALARGPVSVVTPIFGLFVVTSSLVGVLFLDEAFTLRKAAGVGFAALSIYLTAGAGT